MKLLEGKNIIITGASRGIGKSIAEVLSAHGANIAYTDIVLIKALEKELSTNGSKVKGYQSDASDFKASEQLINDVLADFGSKPDITLELKIIFQNLKNGSSPTKSALQP